MTAEERRETIIAAASIEFARTGYAGTAAEAIASRAGVSQPYLFQLFKTKKEIFLATVEECFERTRRTFEQSGRDAKARGLSPTETLKVMGHAYVQLLADRDVLRMQLQAYAACGDRDVQDAVRRNYLELWRAVTDLSGGSEEEVHTWFAEGMLINVVASMFDVRTMEDFMCAVRGVQQ